MVVFLVMSLEGIPFVGPFIPAQLFLLAAGFVASLGHIHVYRMWAVALGALIMADIMSFALGRKFGSAFLLRLPSGIQRRTTSVQGRLSRHLKKSLLAAQFLGPARALIPPLAGAAKVPWGKFLVWNTLGCLIWVTFCIAAGWFFGASYAALAGHMGRGAVLVVVVALVVYLAVQRFRAAKTDDPLAFPPE